MLLNHTLSRGGAPSVSSPAADPAAGQEDPDVALYVATDLDCWITHEARYYARVVEEDERPYRRLDPAYYAWLFHRILRAGMTRKAGECPELTYAELCRRFNPIQDWAMGRPNRGEYVRAVQDFDEQQFEDDDTIIRTRVDEKEKEAPVEMVRTPRLPRWEAQTLFDYL